MTNSEVVQFIISKLENNPDIIQNHPILSQEFIKKLIYILYHEGYYELLLYKVFDKFYEDDININKIKAHVLGSDKIGKYLEAYYLLLTISSDDDNEIINMRTAAVSNMRRYQLIGTRKNNNQKKEIIKTLISWYKKAFEYKNSYHYYPGINLAYMSAIATALFDNDIKLDESINSIYNKSKKSIDIGKNSDNTADKYYANITYIEFMLLQNIGSPMSKLEHFLESKEQTIPLLELERTKRQMQFFIDTVINFGVTNNLIVSNMQKSTKLIDDFIDYLSEFKI